MANPQKAPRLYLRAAGNGRQAVWLIRDGRRSISTGCGPGREGDAKRHLADYLKQPGLVSRAFLGSRIDLARRRAVRKGREFSLTVDDLIAILDRQEWRCALTDMPFDLTEGSPWARPRSLAIDRRDNARGYTPDNVRLVLHAMNVAIGPWGEDAFATIAASFLKKRSQPKR